MHVPEIKFWITTGAIWPVGSFLIALWLAWFGLRESMSKLHAITIVACIAILSFVGWWDSAQQNEHADAQEREIALTRKSVQPINSQMSQLQQKIDQIKAQNEELVAANARLDLVERTRQQDFASYASARATDSVDDLQLDYTPSILLLERGQWLVIENPGKVSFTIISEKFNTDAPITLNPPMRVDAGVVYNAPISNIEDRLKKLASGDPQVNVRYTMTLLTEHSFRYLARFYMSYKQSGDAPHLRISVISIDKIK